MRCNGVANVHFWHETGYHFSFFHCHEYRVKPDQHTPIQDHACPNCAALTSGNYCHNCGQETHLHHASLREFLHEFIGHYVALEGRLWGTLGRLMFRPGALTNEYIGGRRVRFVQPLRLYLTLSLIFFAALRFSANAQLETAQNVAPPAAAQLSAAQAAKVVEKKKEKKQPAAEQAAARAAAGQAPDEDDDMDQLSHVSVGKRSVGQWLDGVPGLHSRVEHFEHLTPLEKTKVLSEGFYHYAPYAIFCMMPVFALFLKVLYLGTGRRFGEHLLFALHTNAFAFALLSLTFLPIGDFLKFLMWLWLLAYLPWAMRRVYHKSRFGTGWRWLSLMACYMVTLGLSFLVALGAGVMTAGH